MSIDLDEVIGKCRFCTKPLGDLPPPACAACVGLEKKATRYRESDPYKKVWNSVEDEEAELLSWVKNGTLFIPTWAEMARRHMSAARYLLRRAREHGRSAEGISVFQEAMFHWNTAKDCLDRHKDVLLKSR